jgi:hypothetical protein
VCFSNPKHRLLRNDDAMTGTCKVTVTVKVLFELSTSHDTRDSHLILLLQ